MPMLATRGGQPRWPMEEVPPMQGETLLQTIRASKPSTSTQEDYEGTGHCSNHLSGNGDSNQEGGRLSGKGLQASPVCLSPGDEGADAGASQSDLLGSRGSFGSFGAVSADAATSAGEHGDGEQRGTKLWGPTTATADACGPSELQSLGGGRHGDGEPQRVGPTPMTLRSTLAKHLSSQQMSDLSRGIDDSTSDQWFVLPFWHARSCKAFQVSLSLESRGL